jgi:hypothetical protein
MQSTRILAASADFDPSKRTVLPASAGVRPVRFSNRDHAISAQVRDVLDSFERSPFLPAPRPVADQQHESIIMEGAEIRRTMRTGSHVVRQNSTAALEVDNTPAPLAFETVADSSIQSAAAVALQQLNDRPHARRGHRLPAKRLVTPRTASTGALWIAFAIAGVVVAMLVKVAVTGVLI